MITNRWFLHLCSPKNDHAAEVHPYIWGMSFLLGIVQWRSSPQLARLPLCLLVDCIDLWTSIEGIAPRCKNFVSYKI